MHVRYPSDAHHDECLPTTLVPGDCDHFRRWLLDQHGLTLGDTLREVPAVPESETLETRSSDDLQSSEFCPSESFDSFFVVPRREQPVVPTREKRRPDGHFNHVIPLDLRTDISRSSMLNKKQSHLTKPIPAPLKISPPFVYRPLKTDSPPVSPVTSSCTTRSMPLVEGYPFIRSGRGRTRQNDIYDHHGASSTVPSLPSSPMFSSDAYTGASRWSMASATIDDSQILSPTSTQFSFASGRTTWIDKLDFGRFSIASIKRKKLVVRGVAMDDERAFSAIRQWCEGFGEVRRISREPDGALHVHFCKTSVADTVCRLHATVYIRGAGSVSLSWFSGRKP